MTQILLTKRTPDGATFDTQMYDDVTSAVLATRACIKTDTYKVVAKEMVDGEVGGPAWKAKEEYFQWAPSFTMFHKDEKVTAIAAVKALKGSPVTPSADAQFPGDGDTAESTAGSTGLYWESGDVGPEISVVEMDVLAPTVPEGLPQGIVEPSTAVNGEEYGYGSAVDAAISEPELVMDKPEPSFLLNQAVIDAAEAWVDCIKDHPNTWADDEDRELINAVNARRTAQGFDAKVWTF